MSNHMKTHIRINEKRIHEFEGDEEECMEEVERRKGISKINIKDKVECDQERHLTSISVFHFSV